MPAHAHATRCAATAAKDLPWPADWLANREVGKPRVILPTDAEWYGKAIKQYALSSEEDPARRMAPAAVVYAASEGDVCACVDAARAAKLAIAVRTGGHQYSGASSTGGPNILLDVSELCRDPETKAELCRDPETKAELCRDPETKANVWDEGTGVWEATVAQSLGELDAAMKEYGVFVPHGQCANVHVGGHAQSGGYGSPTRAFGLFGDAIAAIRLITSDGEGRWYARDAKDPAEADVFWAVLGGGPGCFGVLTRIRLRPYLDDNHPRARCVKFVADYDPTTLRRLLEIKAAMVGDAHPNPAVGGPLPADYDMTITVMSDALFSGGFVDPVVAREDLPVERKSLFQKAGVDKGSGRWARLVRALAKATPVLANIFGPALNWAGRTLPLPFGVFQGNVIVVWGSWANLGGADQPAQDEVDAVAWLDSIKAASTCWLSKEEEMNPRDMRPPTASGADPPARRMSEMREKFVFPIRREFYMPYDKRTYFTAATDLATSGWVDMTVQQVSDLVNNGYRVVSAVVQIMHSGGAASRFTTNDPEGRTAYSWRKDGTLVHIMDAFYQAGSEPGSRRGGRDTSRAVAAAWQGLNDIWFKDAELGTFSPGYDRRLLWGSYHTRQAEREMWRAWPLYHEDEAKYKRLCAIKRRVDPGGMFTPNEFSDLLGPADGAGPALDPRNMRPGAPVVWKTK